MSEISLIDVKAQVMTYDEGAKKWTPSGSGDPSLSKVQLFRHQQNSTHRIVARKIVDKEVVINCALVKGMRYNRATGTFHQWRDVRQVYGINFANGEDATQFGDAVQEALDGGSKPKTSLSNNSFNGDNTELERERQKQLEEQREKERENKAREAEEEAEKRRLREEKLRKEKEEQIRLEQERREKDELQRRLDAQRKKEEEEEDRKLEERERQLEQRVAEKQRELDEMRALEIKAQEDLQKKAQSSPRHTPKRVEVPVPEPEMSTGNAFGVSLRSPAAARNDSPNPTPSSSQQYEEPAQGNIEAVALPRAPSPVYNIPAPPPDIPSSPSINRNRLAPQTSSAQTVPLNKTKSVPTQKSVSQDHLMDEIQRKLAARKKLTEKSSEDSSQDKVNKEPANIVISNVASNTNKFASLPRTNQSSFKKQDSNKSTPNPSASLSPFRQSTLIDKKEKSDISSEELQALKTEIMKDIKVELERTKQEILAEIRKELGKR